MCDSWFCRLETISWYSGLTTETGIEPKLKCSLPVWLRSPLYHNVDPYCITFTLCRWNCFLYIEMLVRNNILSRASNNHSCLNIEFVNSWYCYASEFMVLLCKWIHGIVMQVYCLLLVHHVPVYVSLNIWICCMQSFH